ncbi:MAG: hypothetical protein HQK66_13295 [Desulfamplus sp.]|nr:hypothetical protein [Desulfamplus sp.]
MNRKDHLKENDFNRRTFFESGFAKGLSGNQRMMLVRPVFGDCLNQDTQDLQDDCPGTPRVMFQSVKSFNPGCLKTNLMHKS